MPAHRTTNEEKAAAGTLKPSRTRAEVKVAALTRWPAPPRHFDAEERAAWKRIGKALLPAGTVSQVDLPFAELLAEEMARRSRMKRNPDEKQTAITAISNLIQSMQVRLGMSGQGRERVQKLPEERPEDEHDELAEFAK